MRLLCSGTHEVWHSYPSTTMPYCPQSAGERRSAFLHAAAECVSPGNSGSAVFERAPDYQRGDPLGPAACVLSLSQPCPAPRDDADSLPSRDAVSTTSNVPRAVSHETGHQATAAETSVNDDLPNQPGHIHRTQYMLQVDRSVFCGVCGVFAMQIRRSRFHFPFPREPRNRYARIARDKLLEGREPDGRGWRRTQKAVVPLTED